MENERCRAILIGAWALLSQYTKEGSDELMRKLREEGIKVLDELRQPNNTLIHESNSLLSEMSQTFSGKRPTKDPGPVAAEQRNLLVVVWNKVGEHRIGAPCPNETVSTPTTRDLRDVHNTIS